MEAGSPASEAMFLTNIPYPLSQAFFLFLQIYLFMTVLGVGCSGLSLVGESGDYSLVGRLLIVVASALVEHRL